MITFSDDITLFVLLRVGVAAVVIGVFSVFSYLQLGEAQWLSAVQTASLLRITLKRHPHVTSVTDVVEHPPPYNAESLTFNWSPPLTLGTDDEIKLSEDDWERDSKWKLTKNSVIVLVTGPIMAILFVVLTSLDAHKARVARIQTTAYRRVILALYTVVSVGSLGYIAMGVGMLSHIPWLAYIVGILGIAGLVSAFAGATLVISQQTAWKFYWREKLSEIALHALSVNDNTTFNEAMLSKADVEAAPAVPLPAAIGFYAATFSLAQLGLTALSQYVEWL